MDACSQCTYMLKCVRDSHEALQLFLLDLVQRVAESSPVSVIGETIWGDEAGSVHILQVPCSQHIFVLHAFVMPRSLTC